MKAYKAKTKESAEREVMRLRKRLSESEHSLIETGGIILRYSMECIMLAKLSASEPQFFNPLEVWKAQKIRDRWLSGAWESTKQEGDKE